MNIGYHSDFMDRIIERADKRQERMEKMINKMLDKSEPILNAGKPKPMTEQEYLQTCNTEQLAEWLQEHMDCASCGCNKDLCYQGYDCCKLAFVEWLKQPHKE